MRTTTLAAALLCGSLVALLGGCGSASVPTGPRGVDELVIPTPSPRPGDFVSRIDNSWLAWQPGARFVLDPVGSDPVGSAGSGRESRVTMVVGTRPEQVAGLTATTVTTTSPDGVSTDWFAQDVRGNVWWLGRAGEWEAGRDGAEAGLFMPADPRVGDGYRSALADGVVEDRVEVVEAPAKDAAFGTLRLEVRSDLEPGVVDEQTYVDGRGLSEVVHASTTPGESYRVGRQEP